LMVSQKVKKHLTARFF